MPWFDLHNPKINWRKRETKNHQQDNMKPQAFTHRISTISQQQVWKEVQKGGMFLFAVLMKPSNIIERK